MEQRRWLLFIALTGVVYFIYILTVFVPYQKQQKAYREAHPELFAGSGATTETLAGAGPATSGTLRSDLFSTAPATTSETTPTSPAVEGEESEIVVSTDLYRVVLTTRGARPSSWIYFDRIPNHEKPEPIEMVPQHEELRGDAQRELPLEVIFKESSRLPYPELNTRLYDYEIHIADDGSTEVVFTSPEVRRLQLVKRYHFRPGSYLTDFEVTLRNKSEKASVRIADRIAETDIGVGIAWGPGMRDPGKGAFSRRDLYLINTVYGTPKGVGHSAPSKNDKKIRSFAGDVLWAGVTDKFFLAAVIPDRAAGTAGVAVRELVRRKNAHLESKTYKPFTIELYNPAFEVAPHRQVSFAYRLFVGPKRRSVLVNVGKETDSKLAGVLFYRSWFGWSRALKLGLMSALNFLHSLFGNYGVAIVILTILIRLIMHPLAHKGMKMQAKTMAEMAKIKPELDEINKKYKGDPAKRNQETMALYKKHGISPLAPLRGCLPMLVQIPIFYALFRLLNQSIDLRGASFLWIDDLSGPDALVDLVKHGWDFTLPLVGHITAINLLPILMAVSQHIMSMLTPTPSREASQKQMMLIFSLIFPILLYNFPSGLFLYWLINNVWQSVHQVIANRLIRKSPEGQAATVKA